MRVVSISAYLQALTHFSACGDGDNVDNISCWNAAARQAEAEQSWAATFDAHAMAHADETS